jgi:hypothetical protein
MARSARGQRAHDRRLYQGHQGHVGVGGHGDGAEQVRCENAGHVDRRGPIGPTDDADRRGIGDAEIGDTSGGQAHGAQHRGEDSELRRRAEQQRTRIGDQGAKVGHRADAHEDHQRRHTAVDGDR